jgi:hypothetical protein
MKTFCFDSHKYWDNGVRILQFAIRETFQESLGFSPFEMSFWHSMGGLLKILKDKFVNLSYVSSYIRVVDIGHDLVGGFSNTQVFSRWRIMGKGHNCFPLFFQYNYLADHFPFILRSQIWWSPCSHQYFVFHEIANMNLLCLLYWE